MKTGSDANASLPVFVSTSQSASLTAPLIEGEPKRGAEFVQDVASPWQGEVPRRGGEVGIELTILPIPILCRGIG